MGIDFLIFKCWSSNDFLLCITNTENSELLNFEFSLDDPKEDIIIPSRLLSIFFFSTADNRPSELTTVLRF